MTDKRAEAIYPLPPGGFLIPEQFASQIVSPQNAIVRPRATIIPAVTNEEVDEALYGKAERDEHGVPIKKEPERKITTPSDDFATIARRMRELGLDK